MKERFSLMKWGKFPNCTELAAGPAGKRTGETRQDADHGSGLRPGGATNRDLRQLVEQGPFRSDLITG